MIRNVLKVNMNRNINKNLPYYNFTKYFFSAKKTHHNLELEKEREREITMAASKEFDKNVNTISNKDGEDYSSIEQYMKAFNEKVYKQNVELTNKLAEVFKDDASPSGAKIFTAVNEINKINLNNSSKLLQVFLSQILKYNDSVRLFIQQSERKNTRFNYLVPFTMFFVWVCGSLYLYSFYKRNYINLDNLFDNVIKFYNDNAPKLFKINIKFPVFDDHRSITNSLNFELHKNIVLIGPHSIGKTESIKHFCLTQALKDVLAVYIDLNTVQDSSLANIVKDKLFEHYQGNDINSLNSKQILSDENSKKLFDDLKNKTVYFIFDNYKHERDRTIVFNHSIPNITCNSNWRSLIVSNNNEVYQSALESNLEVKYVNFMQTRTYKNYLVEKLNAFVKKRVEFSNLELFTEDNINVLFRHFYYFSYADLFKYLEANNSIESYVSKKEENIQKKIRMLKVKDPQSYELLNKLVSSSTGKQFEWTKLPSNAHLNSIKVLENLELIFTRDCNEYVMLNGRTKEILSKV